MRIKIAIVIDKPLEDDEVNPRFINNPYCKDKQNPHTVNFITMKRQNYESNVLNILESYDILVELNNISDIPNVISRIRTYNTLGITIISLS